MQAALDAEWPYVEELFEPVDAAPGRGRHRRRPDARCAPPCWPRVEQVARRGHPDACPTVPPAVGGGRRGLHTEHLGYLLAEMQHLHRSHPGATW